MSDDWPAWTPPGEADPDADAGAGSRDGDTVAFSSEATQQVRRDGPPPPPPAHQGPAPPPVEAGPPVPPPPQGSTWTAAGQWQPPPVGGQPPASGAAGSWQPPPSGGNRGVVIALVVAVGVLLVGAAAVVGLVRSGSMGGVEFTDQVPPPLPDDFEADPFPDDFEAPGRPGIPDPPPQPPADVGEVAPDLTSQTEAVLAVINASEERMLGFQQVVVGSLEEDGSVGNGAGAIAQEAGETGDDLTALRSDLRALAGGEGTRFDGLRDIRDTYVIHMDAWIDYVDAVSGSPAIAGPNSTDAARFWNEIERSGDEFVSAVRFGMSDDVPERLHEFAVFIVERGFGGFARGGEAV